MKTTTNETEDVTALDFHPALKDFPRLTEAERIVLTASVERNGIQIPLIITEENKVIDGRERLEIARALELDDVPVSVVNMKTDAEVRAFAFENRVTAPNMTRSRKVLFILELHPDLAMSGGGRAGRPKKLENGSPISGDIVNSFRQLAERYKVPREYFDQLAEMRREATADEWKRIELAICNDGVPISRLYPGFKTGLKAGSRRGAVIYAGMIQGTLVGILPRAFSSIREGFSRWAKGEFDSAAKVAIEHEWAAILDEAPLELQRIAKKKWREA
jgi:hypothetical protein